MIPEEKVIRRIEALLRRLKMLNDNLAPNLAPNDLRRAFIGLPGNVLHSYLLFYGAVTYTITRPEWWIQSHKRPITSGDIEAIRNLESMERHSSFVFFMSKVEWNLRKLITYLFPGACNNGGARFKAIYNHLFGQLGLTQYGGLFDISRHLRNSIHSNGIFISRESKDVSITWKRTLYHFRHMKVIDCAGQDTLLGLCDDTIDCIRDMLNHPSVKTPPFIEDKIH